MVAKQFVLEFLAPQHRQRISGSTERERMFPQSEQKLGAMVSEKNAGGK